MLMKLLPPFLVVGPSIRRSVAVASTVLSRLKVPSDAPDDVVKEMVCSEYHRALVDEVQVLVKKTTDLSLDSVNGIFLLIGADIAADTKAMLQKASDVSSSTKVPASRLFAEAPPMGSTNCTLSPRFSLFPSSALALLLLLYKRAQFNHDSEAYRELSYILRHTAPAVVRFLFEHMVPVLASSGVTNATIARDSRLNTALALSEVPTTTELSSSSWVLKELAFDSDSSTVPTSLWTMISLG
jgi:hypothetical protein